ncbi:MAG: tetratricopeptide repeat protein [Planctomycetes bacterium]|nr:tetratricopeptide repeat protein [Planctomycetota bacterium]
MDLTSLPQKSTSLLALLLLSALMGMATNMNRSQADDSAVGARYQNQSSRASDVRSTLTFVGSQSDTADASDFEQTLNTLRPAATRTASQQTAGQRKNSIRGESMARPNQSNALKLQPKQSVRPLSQAMAISNPARPKNTARPTVELRPPAQIQQTVSQPAPAIVQKPAPRQQPQADNSVRVAEHQEAVTPAIPVDPVVESLVNAHQLSLQAVTEKEYTTIVRQCQEAIRLGASAEHRIFARQLSSWAFNRRGQLLADNGQADLADADFRTALDYQPNNWRALHNRGVSFAQRGQFAEAFDDFNRVIKLNPRYAKAYTNRATLYIQANDLPSALDDYQRALDRDPKLVTAQIGISRVCHLLGQWEKAAEHFSAAMALDPTNANIVCSRGDLLADMGRYRDALADYARTIELNPEFAHAYRNGAWLLATCPNEEFRDAENAILGAKQALDFGYGDRHVALDTLAAALANAGQFQEAVVALQEALETAPTDAKIAYLSRLQLYQDDQPFRTQPAGEVEQAVYEVSDQ